MEMNNYIKVLLAVIICLILMIPGIHLAYGDGIPAAIIQINDGMVAVEPQRNTWVVDRGIEMFGPGFGLGFYGTAKAVEYMAEGRLTIKYDDLKFKLINDMTVLEYRIKF